MTAYLDSSVILRIVLGQQGVLRDWRKIRRGICSRLTEVECLRTIDRLRLRSGISDEVVATRRESLLRLLDSMELVELSVAVLARASNPLPTELGTLDAIHLSCAQLWREKNNAELVMATHDVALATAARALGFPVIGTAQR